MSILKSTKQIFRQCASVPSPHFALFNFIIELRKLFTECLVLNWKVTHVAKYWSWLASAHFKLELDNKAILCYLMDGTRQDKGGCDWQYQGELDPNRWNCVQSFMLGKEKWEPSDPFWGPHDYKSRNREPSVGSNKTMLRVTHLKFVINNFIPRQKWRTATRRDPVEIDLSRSSRFDWSPLPPCSKPWLSPSGDFCAGRSWRPKGLPAWIPHNLTI